MLGEPLDRVARSGHSRQVPAVDRLEPPDDLLRDLLRRIRHPKLVVHVARPLERAHAHHLPLRAFVPAAAALARELFAHLVPDVLGLEQDAVEVEHDGLDHSAA